MNRFTWTAAFAGVALGALAAASAAEAQTAAPAAPVAAQPAEAPAAAQRAPKKAKATKAAAKSDSTVTVSAWNSRSTDLTELQAAESGSPSFKKVLGKLKAGQKTSATVPKGKDCKIDLHATFADGQTTEAEGVDACAQKVLNLTE